MLNTGAVRECDKWLKHAGSMGTRESVVILCVYVVLLQMDDPVLICLCMFGRNDISVLCNLVVAKADQDLKALLEAKESCDSEAFSNLDEDCWWNFQIGACSTCVLHHCSNDISVLGKLCRNHEEPVFATRLCNTTTTYSHPCSLRLGHCYMAMSTLSSSKVHLAMFIAKCQSSSTW